MGGGDISVSRQPRTSEPCEKNCFLRELVSEPERHQPSLINLSWPELKENYLSASIFCY